MGAGEDVQAYWEAVPRGDGTPRYATDLLADPANTLAVTVNGVLERVVRATGIPSRRRAMSGEVLR